MCLGNHQERFSVLSPMRSHLKGLEPVRCDPVCVCVGRFLWCHGKDDLVK